MQRACGGGNRHKLKCQLSGADQKRNMLSAGGRSGDHYAWATDDEYDKGLWRKEETYFGLN